MNEPRLNDYDEKNLKEVFKLEAKLTDNQVNEHGLMRIFKSVGFEPNKSQLNVFKEVLDANGGFINQSKFL